MRLEEQQKYIDALMIILWIFLRKDVVKNFCINNSESISYHSLYEYTIKLVFLILVLLKEVNISGWPLHKTWYWPFNPKGRVNIYTRSTLTRVNTINIIRFYLLSDYVLLLRHRFCIYPFIYNSNYLLKQSCVASRNSIKPQSNMTKSQANGEYKRTITKKSSLL